MTFSKQKSVLTTAALVSLFASNVLRSESLDQAIGVETATTEAAVKSQQKIDDLVANETFC